MACNQPLLPDLPLTALTHPSPLVSFALAARESRNQVSKGAVLSKIEDIIETMVDCLAGNDTQLEIPLASRSNRKRLGGGQRADSIAIRFPGKNEKESWRFAVLLRILEYMHEALVSGCTMTKRDIYYRDPGLFTSQLVVDRFVDDLEHTFQVERKDLNITAAAKGLIFGPITLERVDGTTIECNVEGGVLIPPVEELKIIHVPPNFEWVIVIEKEATFHALSGTSICQSWSRGMGSGVLMTGKGYPDIMTREFVSFLARVWEDRLDIYTLTDFDPDGIAIHLTYKHGSETHRQLNLATPSALRLGIGSRARQNICEGVMLSRRDRSMARRLLGKDIVLNAVGLDCRLRTDLQTMLMLNMKLEIQQIGLTDDDLAAYLEQAMENSGWEDEDFGF